MIARRFISMLVSVAVLAGIVAHAADDLNTPRTNPKPTVLLHSEPPDSAIVTLPGPAPEPVAPSPVPVESTRRDRAPDEPRPFLRRGKREYPPGFEEDSPKFLQGQIGQWKEFDAQDLLGKPLRQRPSFDDAGKENGHIYAYDDPMGRYKGLELDFAGDTGELRTVFIYPVKMTWQACRQVYGSNVTSAATPQGRKFYSYLNRRMDVLVDASGRVISLGFY
jgi:hypothetical protein